MEREENLELLLTHYTELAPLRAELYRALEVLRSAFSAGGKLLVGGNGGSAADSEHMVGELMKSFAFRRSIPTAVRETLSAQGERGARVAAMLEGALPAIAITGHDALQSAFGNDGDWKFAMAQQVYGYGRAGDVLLAISTSGNSENVLNAAETARALGLKVIALTGKTGGALVKIADVALIVPRQETYRIQELHLPIYHALCLALETAFFGEDANK